MKKYLALLLLCFVSCANGASMDTLNPCPDSPNCVCSLETKGKAQVAPFQIAPNIDNDNVIALVAEVVNNYPRTKIINSNPQYLHAEFKTLLLRFVDDVEFLVDQDKRLLHIRSASRVGYSDLGKNRSRYQDLKKRLIQAGVITK